MTGRRLEGLYNPETGDYGLAVYTVRMMRRLRNHVTTREEVLRMKRGDGRPWTEEEIAGILAANDDRGAHDGGTAA